MRCLFKLTYITLYYGLILYKSAKINGDMLGCELHFWESFEKFR